MGVAKSRGPQVPKDKPNRPRKQSQFTPVQETTFNKNLTICQSPNANSCPPGAPSLVWISTGDIGSPKEPSPKSGSCLPPTLVVQAIYSLTLGSEKRPSREQRRSHTHSRLLS